ncbi:MAG: hypothetical protein N2317_08735 [Syntrophales bacterium]|nr:hypothetical protein [Syntrophales bacterium]
MMFKKILEPIFSSLFDFSNLHDRGAVGRTQGETTGKQEELKKYLQEVEEKAKKEAIERKKAGEEIVSKVGIGSKPLTTSTILGSGTSNREKPLENIDWENPKPTSFTPGVSDSARERIIKTACFLKMAETAILNGDLETGRFWAAVAFEGTSVSPRQIPQCSIPGDAIDTKKALDMNRKLTQYSIFFRKALPKFDLLQNLYKNIDEVKIQKERSEMTVKEIEKHMKELETQKGMAQSPAEIDRINELLAKDLVLKAQAEVEYQKILKEEQRLLKEKKALEDELNEMIAEVR